MNYLKAFFKELTTMRVLLFYSVTAGIQAKQDCMNGGLAGVSPYLFGGGDWDSKIWEQHDEKGS